MKQIALITLIVASVACLAMATDYHNQHYGHDSYPDSHGYAHHTISHYGPKHSYGYHDDDHYGGGYNKHYGLFGHHNKYPSAYHHQHHHHGASYYKPEAYSYGGHYDYKPKEYKSGYSSHSSDSYAYGKKNSHHTAYKYVQPGYSKHLY